MYQERDVDLANEQQRQEENDQLRKQFAGAANAFHAWLTETRSAMMEGSGTLEDQLEATKVEFMIVFWYISRYTEHSTVGLAQQWDQLDQLGMRMQHNLDQQIQARNRSGVSEDALREFSMMFKHFDKDKSGKLDHQEFKSCLRALGYDLPVVEEGQVDPEFQAILDMVDPNRDGHVSLQEYMAFMISRETENVQSSSEVEQAFRALTSGDKPFITSQELYANLTREQADYCIGRMKPFVDRTGRVIPDAYDYADFTSSIFGLNEILKKNTNSDLDKLWVIYVVQTAGAKNTTRPCLCSLCLAPFSVCSDIVEVLQPNVNLFPYKINI
ncbi:SPTCA-like protein [Mya arenaria]|uniref:SPTCA-like protein n=1 Tax=Mya arenaria TaxID=6604 RepID=A0ABY7GBP4_MYAAR|nr:SPTCA-like protein [Mya arenaria]